MATIGLLPCRACFVERMAEGSKHLLHEIKLDYDLSSLIFKLTGIRISGTENWLEIFCNKCAERLIQIERFRLKFIESDIKFRNLLLGKQLERYDTIELVHLQQLETNDELDDLQEDTTVVAMEQRQALDWDENCVETMDGCVIDGDSMLENCNSKAELKRKTERNANEKYQDDKEMAETMCNICGKHFPSLHSRRVHEVVHNRGHFECTLCSRILTTAGFLRLHLRNTHNIFEPQMGSTPSVKSTLVRGNCQCDICKNFFTEDRIARHMKIHARKPMRPKCTQCPLSFSCLKNLQRHQKMQHSDDSNRNKIASFTCAMCSESFYRAVELYEHTKMHDGLCDETDDGYNLLCEKCSAENQFQSLEMYANHMTSMHSDLRVLPYKCRICSMRVGSKTGLYKHVTHHYGRNSAAAIMINTSMNAVIIDGITQVKLEIEPNLMVSSDEKSFHCVHCDHRFRTARRLEEHTRVHTGEEPYECMQCTKRFKTRMTLGKHIKSRHSAIRDHLCSVCGKDFCTKAVLEAHLNLHNGTRPFPCEYCDKSFGGMSRLREHTRIHTNERPYICDQCPKAFRSHTNLRHHKISVHTDERKHSCTICTKTFKFNSNLKAHMWTHSGDEKPFNCSKCREGFMRLKRLKEHEHICNSGIVIPNAGPS